MIYTDREENIINGMTEISQKIDNCSKAVKLEMLALFTTVTGIGVTIFSNNGGNLGVSIFQAAVGTYLTYTAISLGKGIKQKNIEISKLEKKLDDSTLELQNEVVRSNIDLDYGIEQEIAMRKPYLVPEYRGEETKEIIEETINIA